MAAKICDKEMQIAFTATSMMKEALAMHLLRSMHGEFNPFIERTYIAVKLQVVCLCLALHHSCMKFFTIHMINLRTAQEFLSFPLHG